MLKIDYNLKGTSSYGCHDAAIFRDDETATPEELAASVVQTIALDIEVDLGEHKVNLAMLQDPEHWEEDWREKGIEDPYAYIAGLAHEG